MHPERRQSPILILVHHTTRLLDHVLHCILKIPQVSRRRVHACDETPGHENRIDAVIISAFLTDKRLKVDQVSRTEAWSERG